MDEMTEVRGLRAEAPVPDRARLAPGRARLLEAARDGQRRRAPWRRREFVIVAVVAAVTAVAVTAALLVGGGSGRKVQPAVTPTVSLKGVSAADLLRRAADVVAAEPDGPVPTAEQWIYTKQAQEPYDEQAQHAEGLRKLLAGPQESWIRYDGTAMAMMEPDHKGEKLTLTTRAMHLENGGEGDDRSAREMYRVLVALPAGGEQTLEALREKNAIADPKGVAQAENDYTEISVLLDADVMPSKGLASLYRALAALPGGSVTDHLVETASGRRAIAVEYHTRSPSPGTEERLRDQWLLDPQTYRVVGMRLVLGDKVVGGSSLVATAVVDRAGERG
ncbi:CU044_5270 family protein [Streptomyces pseudovenezuelae]|uniref:CU044_5270 family protein n=1 Tax=Streptomyces pseudovenezuelae TaxID=67350 RepID=UPI002E33AD88|nr:CU044_5270 family protein [Streptomyces pseudovenezuelae]